MSTVAPETTPSSPAVSLENLLFDYPGADVILRSCDSYEFRVLKIYILHSSPVLGERVLAANCPQSGPAVPAHAAATSLPVVQLSDSGAILFSLLNYIFPVQPILPSTVEQTMELLSAAQKYKMDAILTHIRNHIAQQHPPFIRKENSLYIYSLAQEHGLRQEVLQAARSTLSLPMLTIDTLDEQLEVMPGTLLHELWKYQQRVRTNLTSDLQDFRARATLNGTCHEAQCPQGVPSWLGVYISSIGRSHLLDLSGFHMALAMHIQKRHAREGCPACATITSQSILEFWAALSAVYRDSITKAEPDLLLAEEAFGSHNKPPGGSSSRPRYTHLPDADVIIQSCDLVNFRVRKSILATSSAFFGDLFSLPQPSDHQVVDGLPVAHLPEDAEVLNSLVTMLYPVPPEIPDSDDNILTLLAACQKYDMTTVQSFIRAEVSRRGLLSPAGAESFRLFAIAYRKRLIPEMKAAARLTLGHPMTFEYLGDALRSFEGWALFDLYRFRRRCENSIDSCLEAILDDRSGPTKVWVGCHTANRCTYHPEERNCDLPRWIHHAFVAKSCFPHRPIVTPSGFREEYLGKLRGHVSLKDCSSCTKTHTLKGEDFCAEVEKKLAQAWDVQYSFRIENQASESSPSSV